MSAYQHASLTRRGLLAATLTLVGVMTGMGDGAAATGFDIRIGQISRNGWVAQDLRLEYSVNDESLALRLRADTIQSPDGQSINGLELDCAELRGRGGSLRCRDPSASANLPRLGPQTVDLTLSYQPSTQTFGAVVNGLDVAGGGLTLEAEWHRGDWRGFIEAESLNLNGLTELLEKQLPAGWAASGQVNADVTLAGRGMSPQRLIARIGTDALTFNDPTGLRAGEGLNSSLAWRARRQGSDWVGQAELAVTQGQLYIDPVFTDFGAHPLSLSGDAVARPADGILELLGFQVSQQGILQVAGDASLTREPPYLARARLHDVTAQLPNAYTTYAQPALRGTAGAKLATAGRLSARLSVRDGALTELRVSPEAVSIADDQGRFALNGITGDIAWSNGDGTDQRNSVLAWRDGSIYGIELGSTRLGLALNGDNARLTSPAAIPVLDGALVIQRFALRNSTTTERSGVLDARLEPVSMGALTESLGWPRFQGRLAGQLPSLNYEDGIATLGGAFRLSAFGGEIQAANVRLGNPLSTLPEFSADVTIDGLDLEALTSTFAFGRITGSLDGRIDNLRLLGWQPAAFRAWFHNPADDQRPHRISQRAVENLASLGGAGGAAALSRGFLRFFEEFRYRDLGLGCVLREDVCVMRGLGEAGQGYYIVRGSGVPRVDVIGYVNTVSWPTLVEQIRSATATGGPVVR